jgi:hypothetical protein
MGCKYIFMGTDSLNWGGKIRLKTPTKPHIKKKPGRN